MENDVHLVEFAKEHKYIIFLLLVLLNIVIRIPTVPHEMGADSFVIHSLANMIAKENPIVNPLSIFGMYPGSYPYAVPYILSGFSQLSGINIEYIILLVAMLFGVIGMFTSYTLAKKINNNDFFAFVVAFSFSLSPVFIRFGLWATSTRYLFMVILPLFILMLLGINGKYSNRLKYVLTSVILFVFLGTIHRMFFLTFVIIIPFIITLFIQKLNIKYGISKNPSRNVIVWLILSAFLFVLQLPPFNIFGNIWYDYQTGVFFQGSDSIIITLNMIVDFISRFGILTIFAFTGLAFISFKSDRNFNEKFLLTVMLFSIPILTFGTYVSLFMLIFATILIAYGIIKTAKNISKSKIIVLWLILCIISSILFSQFMLLHWGLISIKGSDTSSISESTVNAGLFLNNYGMHGVVVTNAGHDPQIAAFSELPVISRYIYENSSNLIIKRRSFLEVFPKIESLYSVTNPTHDVFAHLYPFSIDSERVKHLISIINLKYMVLFEDVYYTEFFKSIQQQKAKIYDNEKSSVWCL